MAAAPVTAADTVSPAATIQTSENSAESPSPRLPRWLQQLLPVSPANAAATTNASRFVGQSIAGNLKPGETRRVSVTMRNTGTSTWTRAGGYKLGTQNPQDNRLWTGGTRIHLSPVDNVRPGQSKTFTFNITAPTLPGTYNFQWRMLQEANPVRERELKRFGSFSPNVVIEVTVPSFPSWEDDAFDGLRRGSLHG